MNQQTQFNRLNKKTSRKIRPPTIRKAETPEDAAAQFPCGCTVLMATTSWLQNRRRLVHAGGLYALPAGLPPTRRTG